MKNIILFASIFTVLFAGIFFIADAQAETPARGSETLLADAGSETLLADAGAGAEAGAKTTEGVNIGTAVEFGFAGVILFLFLTSSSSGHGRSSL